MSQRRIQRFAAGQELTSGSLNRIVDEVNSIATPVREEFAQPGFLASNLLALEIKTINFPATAQGDLICILPGESGNAQAKEWGVFLPNLYTEASRPFPEGNTTYVYASVNQRTASRSGETDEVQYLTPPLLVGEVIVAYDERGNFWRMYGDGRMWAIDPPASP